MLNVESKEFNSSGIADLSEAIDLAKRQGISIARGAVNDELLWPMFSLGSMVGVGMARQIPGVIGGTVQVNGNSVYGMDPSKMPNLLHYLLEKTEERVLEAAGDELPGWRPTKSMFGIRMVVMKDGAEFVPHTDDYEGLVAAVQLGIDGKKVMGTNVGGEWQEEQLEQGDIALFGGDTFSERSRAIHGFSFTGLYAVSFTLGQDPWYTISGRYPLIDVNPLYGLSRPGFDQ